MANEKEVFISSQSVLSIDDNFVAQTKYSNTTNKSIDIVNVTLLEEPKTVDSVYGLEGELLTSFDNNKTDYVIDIDGNLLVLYSDNEDYSINDNGELILKK